MTKDKYFSLTQHRMISQITSIGASVFSPRGFACVPDIRYPALITAERNIIADGEVHLSVAQRLCKLRNRGTSGNSCKDAHSHSKKLIHRQSNQEPYLCF